MMETGKMNESRRNFMKKSLAGLAGAAVLPSMLRAQQDTQKKEERKIVFRVLGKTGIRVPVVSIGAQAKDQAVYRAALEAGLTHFDTANRYGNGQHETMVGEIVKGRPRESFVITTKVYQPFDQKTGLYKEGASEEKFINGAEEGLKRLGVDYVDMLLLHAVSRKGAVLYEPALNALQKLKKDGKARAVGVSTHTNEPEVILAAVESGVHEVVLTAYNFRQPHLKEMNSAISKAAEAGLGIVAMKTQAGVFWDKERREKIDMKAALKWVLKNENVHTTIPGFETFEQLEEDLSVMENLRMTEEEKKALEVGFGSGLRGLYCSQCGLCREQCGKGFDIPSLMRSYMYAYGYRDLAMAKRTAEPVLSGGIPCRDCNSCNIRCTMGFDVREKIEDIARLEQVPDEFIV
ncbi:MAG: oxidoreductase [Candidatus Latescibacteria bacterium]|nr:oxidoreductase [bacterium]MBD3423722.1 oxidoreductase [Candidatus Latescibacterota bacterium]